MAGLDRGPRGRILLFPLPFQGHLSPMLQLADVLHGRGLAVTILHYTGFRNTLDARAAPGVWFRRRARRRPR